jgi:hypothetical protein
MPKVVVSKTCARGLGRIALSVRNATDDPIHGLRVELVVAAKGVIAIVNDGVGRAELPKRPIMLGKATSSFLDTMMPTAYVPDYGRLLSPTTVRSIGPRVEIDNSNSARLTFPSFDLYADTTADLEEFYLLTNVAHAGNVLVAKWSARANNVSGVIRGTLEIEVDPHVPTIKGLLAEQKGRIEPDAEDGADDGDEGD